MEFVLRVLLVIASLSLFFGVTSLIGIAYIHKPNGFERFERLVSWNFDRWVKKGKEPYLKHVDVPSQSFIRETALICEVVFILFIITLPFTYTYGKIRCCFGWVFRQR